MHSQAGTADSRAIPQPWDYNPSSWKQRGSVAALAMVAFVIALYLAFYQLRIVDSVWDPLFGAQTMAVLDSQLSQQMYGWIRIPDALLGAIAYLSDAVFAMAGGTRRWQYRPWLVIIFGIDVIPLGGVSALLILAQFVVVGEYCFLCMVTAVISLMLIYFAYDEVWSSVLFLWRVWKKHRDRRLLWHTLWGRASAEADAVARSMVKQPEGAEVQR